MEGEDVGMLEPARRLGFLLDPSQAFRIRGEIRGQDLDGDLTPQALIEGAADLPPPAPSGERIS